MSDETIGELSERRYPLLALVTTFGRSDSHYLALAVAAQAIKSFIGFADVFFIGLAIDALFNGRAYSIPLVPASWIPTEPLPLLGFVGALLFALNLTTILGNAVSSYGAGVFTQRLLHEIRISTFDDAQRLERGFFDENRTGNVMSVLNDDVNQLESFFGIIVTAAVWIVVTLVAAFVYMSVLNRQLALFVLLSGPVIAGANYWFSRRLEPLQDDVRTERGALNARLETNISAIDVIKSFVAEEYERKRVEASSLENFRARFRSRRVAVRQAPLNRLIIGIWLLLTLAIGVYWNVARPPLFFSGTLTAGQLVPFLFYMERMTLPLKNLAGVVDAYESANASARRIDGLANVDRRIERKAGDELAVDDASVTFEDVRFSYPRSDRRAVDGVTFAAKPGETIGIVGTTGAGKSTLVKLLLRFYEVDGGAILVDEQDVRDVSLRSLRDAVGYVNQEPFLFDGTVRYNIAYGSSGAADERIETAAREAGAHEFITQLPDGYDTQVGEQGTELSGGQRQRIAIARAVVGDPPILVFDEATSHVDNETELILQEKLDELTENRTTLVVAHRLSTVRSADRILVLEDGVVVERGTHDELVERDGPYAALWNIQIGNLDALPLDVRS